LVPRLAVHRSNDELTDPARYQYREAFALVEAMFAGVAAKIGCTAQSLNEWVKKAEIDSGVRGGVPAEIAERLKALERENRELRQANEILRKASAYFAQAELDRRFKP
jgi:transposase